MTLGAPYGDATPWMLRDSILESLLKAQQNLSHHRRGWRIKLFDAYRPAIRTLIGDGAMPLERARKAVSSTLAQDLGLGETLTAPARQAGASWPD